MNTNNNIETLQQEQVGESRIAGLSRDLLRRISINYTIWLLIAFCMAGSVYFVFRNSGLGSVRPMFFVYCLIILGHVIFRFYTGGKNNILAPDVIFLLFYTLFHLGYILLYSLHLVPYIPEIFVHHSTIPRALFVVNLGLLGFIFGYELLGLKVSNEASSCILKIPKGSWCIFGLVVMVAALLLHLFALACIGMNTLVSYGYDAIQGANKFTSATIAMILWQSNPLMVFGAIAYMIASAMRCQKLFHSKFALILVVTFLSIYVLEGDRGPIFLLGAPVLLIRHYFVKRIKIRYLAVIFIGVIILFNMMSAVRNIVFNPSKMWGEYKYQKGSGVVGWKYALMEMGGSFRVTVMTCQEVPSNEGYWKGQSLLSAALHVVPFLEGYCIRKGMRGYTHFYIPSVWATETFVGREHSGVGFTVATEGYLNFGFPGAFFELMFLGLFIRAVMIKFSRNPSAARAFIMIGCLGISIQVIRNHLEIATNVYFQIFIIAGLLNYFCGNEQYSSVDYPDTFEDNGTGYSVS
jgi:hypothetical protein